MQGSWGSKNGGRNPVSEGCVVQGEATRHLADLNRGLALGGHRWKSNRAMARSETSFIFFKSPSICPKREAWRRAN